MAQFRRSDSSRYGRTSSITTVLVLFSKTLAKRNRQTRLGLETHARTHAHTHTHTCQQTREKDRTHTNGQTLTIKTRELSLCHCNNTVSFRNRFDGRGSSSTDWAWESNNCIHETISKSDKD